MVSDRPAKTGKASACAKGLVITLLCTLSAASYSTEDCFEREAKAYNINISLAQAIVANESNGNARAFHVNEDKSVDVGYMQINSYHFPQLLKEGISESDLYDRCTNIRVGMRILSGFVKQYGYTWRAIGAYGAGNRPDREAARQKYANKISSRLFERNASADKKTVFSTHKELDKSRMVVWLPETTQQY